MASKDISIFLSYFRPHIALFAADMACATLVALADAAFPMVSRYAIDAIIPSADVQRFLILAAILIAGYLFRRECTWFVNYWGHLFGAHVECDMRRDVFAKLEGSSLSFFDTHRTGHLISRATTDLFEITELAHHGPEDVLISLLTLVLSFAMLLMIEKIMAIIVLAFLIVIIIITAFSRRSLSAASRKVKDITSTLVAMLESSISGIRVTKSFACEEREKERFEGGNGEYYNAKKCFYKSMSSFHANIEFFNGILNVVVLTAGGIFIMQGKMTVADLVAANLFVSAFMHPIARLTNFVEQFSTGMAGFTRFLEIMRSPVTERDSPDAVPIGSVKGGIEFRNVSFRYDKHTGEEQNMAVLNNVNLVIKAGERLALVGPSGGGKTTLSSLIPRFYEATSGTILLDNVDTMKYTLQSLRRKIGIVQQDVFLFAGTVKENIAYGKAEATDEEIINAAKRAEIHDDIIEMVNGYDTLVGERGVRLSGGQKQRIAIARCLLKNPPILILDEATSALDSVTEMRIQSAFDELSRGRTTIIIAHRLSTVRNASRIAVIDRHRILELGTHDELMARSTEYRKLYESQWGKAK